MSPEPTWQKRGCGTAILAAAGILAILLAARRAARAGAS